MLEISIKNAGLDDLEAAFRIVEEYYEAACVIARDTKDEFARTYFGERSGVWLALLGNDAVGCIALRELREMPQSGEIKRLYVQPAYRRLGTAQTLLKTLESFALEVGYKWLYLDSAPGMDAAVRFYQRHEYDPCPRYNDNPQATIFLCKGLT
jgi:GNAT superfamily N-acetyltransferase